MINILPASLHDGEMLRVISEKTFDDDSRRFFKREKGGPPGYNDLEHHRVNIEENNYYKICLHDEIIGGIILTDKDETHMELSTIYIAPEYQDRGYGQKIIKQIEGMHPKIKKWTLDTPSVCVRNHHLYEKCGYKKTNEMLLDSAMNLKLYFYEKEMN